MDKCNYIMGADREKYCDYCKNYLQDYDLCKLTGRKPSFEAECTDYNEIEGIVKAVPATSLKRKKSPCERKTYTAITLIWGIVSVVVVVYFRLHIVDWVKELFAPEEKQEYVMPKMPAPDLNKYLKGMEISRGVLPKPNNYMLGPSSPHKPAGEIPQSIKEKMDSVRVSCRELQDELQPLM